MKNYLKICFLLLFTICVYAIPVYSLSLLFPQSENFLRLLDTAQIRLAVDGSQKEGIDEVSQHLKKTVEIVFPTDLKVKLQSSGVDTSIIEKFKDESLYDLLKYLKKEFKEQYMLFLCGDIRGTGNYLAKGFSMTDIAKDIVAAAGKTQEKSLNIKQVKKSSSIAQSANSLSSDNSSWLPYFLTPFFCWPQQFQ